MKRLINKRVTPKINGWTHLKQTRNSDLPQTVIYLKISCRILLLITLKKKNLLKTNSLEKIKNAELKNSRKFQIKCNYMIIQSKLY